MGSVVEGIGMIDGQTQTSDSAKKGNNEQPGKIVGVGLIFEKLQTIGKGFQFIMQRIFRGRREGSRDDEKAPCVQSKAESSAELDPARTQSSEIAPSHTDLMVPTSSSDPAAVNKTQLPPAARDEVEDFKHEAKSEIIPKSFALN